MPGRFAKTIFLGKNNVIKNQNNLQTSSLKRTEAATTENQQQKQQNYMRIQRRLKLKWHLVVRYLKQHFYMLISL